MIRLLAKKVIKQCVAQVANLLLSKKDCVEMATQIDVYKYFYKKCVEILHSCVEI